MKLVAEVGVGTVAAGVSKAHADVVLISGHDGGTGAAPLTSLKHAGGPWELGLAETQQTLLLNGLRDRIVVQADGQLKTGRDVVIAALLGAEEFGFATAPLVVSGCIMMRVCHLDTCPVGVATQNPVLRERFTGKPEFVVTFFEYIAEEVRELLAELGFRTLDEADRPGRAASTSTRRSTTGRPSGLDLTPILARARAARRAARCTTPSTQDHGLDKALDNQLIAAAPRRPRARRAGRAPQLADPQRQPHRRHDPRPRGHQGATAARACPTAPSTSPSPARPGQSLRRVPAARASRCGSRATPTTTSARASPAAGSSSARTGRRRSTPRRTSSPATSSPTARRPGEIFLRGRVGERFCVRNSGATAVVEGVGDHGCEYMTGGRVVVLGPTGRNFAAGMSGGVAYVLDLDHAPRQPRAGRPRPAAAPRTSSSCTTCSSGTTTRTGSPVADALLADWDTARSALHRGHAARLPAGARRARAEAAAEGLDPDGAQVWERIMEASRG